MDYRGWFAPVKRGRDGPHISSRGNVNSAKRKDGKRYV